jgi:diguanylate cyclase (GGDEF)-like protein
MSDMETGSWLIRDGMGRERMLDMDRRIAPARRRSFAVLGVALLACGPWLGWWTLIPLVIAGVGFRLAERHTDSTPRPEYAMFGAWVAAEVIIAVSVALTGGPRMATMSWLAIPIITLASRFSDRGIAAGVGIATALLLAVAFGVDPHAVIHDPTLVIAPLALLIAITLLSVALMRSEVEHRSRAVIDPLTGMLNRTALASRVEELEQQSEMTGEPIGLVVADIDCFKQVNDSHGHRAGDSVLTDVAYTIRKQLRAFDLAYRAGGEEFVVLLPGADRAASFVIAETLRAAVEAGSAGDGLDVTISCGVSASERGASFRYDSVFAEADRALYVAKRSGRNRVCDAESSEHVAVA